MIIEVLTRACDSRHAAVRECGRGWISKELASNWINGNYDEINEILRYDRSSEYEILFRNDTLKR